MSFRDAALLVGLLIFGIFWIDFSRSAESPINTATRPEAPIVGFTAPDFVLQTVEEETVQLSELRGTPIVLNFWATWCGPCRYEMPALTALADEFDGKVLILGVNQGESAEKIPPFAAEFEIEYPLLIDPGSEINHQYRVRGLPTTLFISAEGIIEDQIIGAAPEAVLVEKVEALITP